MSDEQCREQPYRREQLIRLFAPKSIAVVGASNREGSFGERVLRNMKEYAGKLYLINPNYQTISGFQAYPSLDALPQVPDCVVLAVPRDAVEQCVLASARMGVGGVVIFASGYGETGSAEDKALEANLAKIARENGILICGPNCMGFANYADKTVLSFTAFHPCTNLMNASIGVASQSGALSFCLGDAMAIGASFSHLFSSGNSCDVDVADLVSYLAEDDTCKSIVCIFEGMKRPRRLLEAAKLAWLNNKPLLIHKIARGEQGAAAAVSHTGSVAGSDSAYAAMFESAGAILVERFEDLVEMAAFFAKAGKPSAEGVAVLSPSGGAAIMAADFAERHQVGLPQPSDVVTRRLKEHIPSFGSSRNPCDVTAQVVNSPASLAECADALMGDNRYGALLLAQPQAYAAAAARVDVIGKLAVQYQKIACNIMVSQWNDGPGAQEAMRHEHVALFRSMDRCFHTLAAWHLRERQRTAPTQISNDRAGATTQELEVANMVQTAPTTVLGESLSKRILATYGVSVTQEELALTEANALQHAEWLGYPVALKVESPKIPHKTEAGVIRLNLYSAEDVRNAYHSVLENAYKLAKPEDVNGVLVQQMLPQGLEIMVGARNDPLFGPLVVVGMGGVMVELLSDTVTALAPVSPDNALKMLRKLKAWPLLQGFRGSKPIGLDQLVDSIVSVSNLIAEHSECIQEIDVNPLICSADKAVAVDALIVKVAGMEVSEPLITNAIQV